MSGITALDLMTLFNYAPYLQHEKTYVFVSSPNGLHVTVDSERQKEDPRPFVIAQAHGIVKQYTACEEVDYQSAGFEKRKDIWVDPRIPQNMLSNIAPDAAREEEKADKPDETPSDDPPSHQD